MSGSPEDEAKARLEVAQLYEGMPGQAVKAARYYFAAAEIFRGAGLNTRAREIYQKVVQLEPSNTQAQTILQSLLQAAGGAAPAAAQPQPQAPASTGLGAPRPVSPPRPAGEPQAAAGVQPPRSIGLGASVPTSQPAAGGDAAAPPRGQVMIPTPWIGREPRYVAAARGQLTAPPDRKILPYDPLPPVDPNKVAARAEARKQAQKELNRKSATRIESAFGNSRSPFVGKPDGGAGKPDGGAGAPAPTGRFGGGPAAPAAEPKPTPKPAPAAEPAAGRFGASSGEMRGGNRDLADAIRRKIQGS